MPLFLLILVASLLVTAVWLVPRTLEASNSAAEAAMRNQIATALDNPSRPNALWGVFVQNLQTGAVVYSRNAEHSFVPASNQKLVTSAVALEVFGPDHRFITPLHFKGTAVDSVMRGDLILRGSGDPTFGSTLSGSDPLATWARGLRDMGVTRFEGRIIGDARRMSSEPYASGWDIDYIANAHWAQAAGALSYADNLVTVQIAGTRPGNPADVRMTPHGYVDLRGAINTRSGRGFSPMKVERTIGTNEIVLDGSVSASYRGSLRLPIHEPTQFTLHAFAERLRRAGIIVQADLVDARTLDEVPSYDDEPIFVHVSPPLLDILAFVNQRSNNFYAEQVFRALSASGTSRASAQRVVSYLQGAGVPTSGLSVRDGSGLSRKNLITPRTMAGLLAHEYQSEHRDAFISTLARGGMPSSTMRFRLGGAPVWAKTGTIEHVRGLSGYVTGPGNTPYSFVLFANQYTGTPAAIGQVQDEIVNAIINGDRRR